ncbi:DnaJ domain-containing protein [Helicobacter burdigaliensis]|uniref:DnaJ domain-containing protein n=1 Tax=Helicobacter burdigaliensis TaxID=2315334 RepID=UPI000EF74058|nr:DnaJ domain-containing protein [Helicobacter burdigaliensis]
MEILILITIVVVVIAFYNFRDYLYNPASRPKIEENGREIQDIKEYENYEDPYKSTSKEDKIRQSELGILVSLMSKVAHIDGDFCPLEKELVRNSLEDIAEQITLQSATYQKEEILEILHNIFKNTTQDVEELTYAYAELTKGQYKRRLKLVEYLLMLAYADSKLEEKEQEVILDVAAYLEIENNDFNKMYDAFAEFYAKDSLKLNIDKAYEILGVSKEATFEEVKKSYKKLVREYHPDILHHKGLEQSIIESATAKLQEINGAYEILKEHYKNQEANNG